MTLITKFSKANCHSLIKKWLIMATILQAVFVLIIAVILEFVVQGGFGFSAGASVSAKALRT